MAIRVEFKHTKADGSPCISFNDWVATLPQQKQEEIDVARNKQIQITEKLKADGHIVGTDETGIVFSDAAAHATHDVPEAQDPSWTAIWGEYLTANNIIFSKVISEV